MGTKERPSRKIPIKSDTKLWDLIELGLGGKVKRFERSRIILSVKV